MNKHLSTQFDAELTDISSKLLFMGGLVEKQITQALATIESFDDNAVEAVQLLERQVNQMEIDIDSDCNHIIARRQPAARDLRLIMATSKAITNLERVGDEATKIAKRAERIKQSGLQLGINYAELKYSGQLATEILRHSLDAFARLDTKSAHEILLKDKAIDQAFRGFVRQLITYMMEDPRTISVSLDLLFIAKAIERIGDHAKNIAEFIIYIVEGTDIRHQKKRTAVEYVGS